MATGTSAHQYSGLRQTDSDIGKKSIPKEERCEDFDRLWNMIFDEVVSYWDEVPDNPQQDTGCDDED